MRRHLEMEGSATAAKLYECRDAAKTLLGEHYHRDITLLAKRIKSKAAELDCNDLQAAIALAKDADGFQTIVILAAAVEMVEPSTPAHV